MARNENDGSDKRLLVLPRRDFLKFAGLSLTACAAEELSGCAPGDVHRTDISLLDVEPVFTVRVYRKDDLVALTFGFVNMILDATRTKVLRDRRVFGRLGTPDALIIVSYEPQHVLEEVFWEDMLVTTPDPPLASGLPIKSRIANRSRVAYRVPDDVDEIPFTTEALLQAASDYEMAVGTNATPPDPPRRFIFSPITIIQPPIIGDIGIISTDTKSIVSASAFGSNGLVTEPVARATSVGAVQAIRSQRGAMQLGASAGVDVGLVAIPINPDIFQLVPTVPSRPTARQTMLELPFRLEVSPNRFGQWAHATKPVSVGTPRVELWHSRLGVRGADGKPYEGPSYLRTIRALWTRDSQFNPNDDFNGPPPQSYDSPALTDPFEASLAPRDRIRIVHQSSNFTLTDAKSRIIKPLPVDVNRLMLTSLGAWLDSRGDWGDDPKLNLALWEHRATMGRDHYVKIVETGYLFPFGHRCVRVTITERKLKEDEHPHIAFLRKRQFIIVKQPTLAYDQGLSDANTVKKLRKLPFGVVVIKTLITPNLDGQPPGSASKIAVGGEPFHFVCEGTDAEGNVVGFTAPAVFVEGNLNSPPDITLASSLFGMYPADKRKAPFQGARVAFAPSSKPDDTSYETKNITFTHALVPRGQYQAGFVPVVDNAELSVAAVRALAGVNGTPAFSFHDRYVQNGFGAGNAGELLFGLATGASSLDVKFNKASDKSGGFITPNLSISGLSRMTGPAAGDLDKLADGKFDPQTFFAGLDAKIFGVFNIWDLIDLLGGGDLLEKAPKFITQAMDAAESLYQDAMAFIDQLQGVAVAGTTALTDLETLVDDITHFRLSKMSPDITQLRTSIDDLITKIPTLALSDGVKQDLLKRVGLLSGVIHSDIIPVLENFLNAIEMAKEQRVRVEWKPRLTAFPSDPIFEPADPENALILAAEARAKASQGKPAGVDLLCSLEKFKLYLIGKSAAFLILDFDHIRFTIESGKKPDVDVKFGGITFAGVLSFVETLKDIIPMEGFSDPPSVSVSADGIAASFSLALPSLAVGMFSLQNISLGAGFRIPFIGDPLTVSFNFCTRENPFLLTVSMIGGGGFFGLTLTPKGVQLLEAQFEAGCELALDFGVASGSVSVMLGVYFKIENDDATLTGFFKIRGEVDVLGIITASIELSMSLTYESATGKLIGRASIEIEITIFFFSFGVTVSCERKFAGSNGDPSFAEIMAPEGTTVLPPPGGTYYPWQEYIEAFAA